MQQTHINPEEPILTPKEGANILGITLQRVSALCAAGVLRYRTIGRFRFPLRASIMEYLENPRRLKYSPKIGPKQPTYRRNSDERTTNGRGIHEEV